MGIEREDVGWKGLMETGDLMGYENKMDWIAGQVIKTMRWPEKDKTIFLLLCLEVTLTLEETFVCLVLYYILSAQRNLGIYDHSLI